MSFLGKVYRHKSDENLQEFIATLGLPEEQAKGYANFKPSLKIEKDDDTYTFSLINPENEQTLTEIKFQSGVEFDDERSMKTTITVDGDVVIQKQVHGEGHVITHKKEYSDNELVETITTSFWDGSAKRIFSAE